VIRDAFLRDAFPSFLGSSSCSTLIEQLAKTDDWNDIPHALQVHSVRRHLFTVGPTPGVNPLPPPPGYPPLPPPAVSPAITLYCIPHALQVNTARTQFGNSRFDPTGVNTLHPVNHPARATDALCYNSVGLL